MLICDGLKGLPDAVAAQNWNICILAERYGTRAPAAHSRRSGGTLGPEIRARSATSPGPGSVRK